MNIIKTVIVIGSGASGLMAAYFASKNGSQVILIEKNEKCGKKIYITGKGRCNVSNISEKEAFLENVVSNPKFLYPSLSSFSPMELIDLFESLNCPIKIERGNRAFPESDKASDVTNVLVKALCNNGVEIRLNTRATRILVESGTVRGLELETGEVLLANAVIVATGGNSYPLTGSNGDGYRLLNEIGHKIIPPVPALVPFNSSADWVKSLQGLSLKNIRLNLVYNKKTIYSELGEMLFTHFGISGPLVLSASSYIAGKDIRQAKILLNLKPALSQEQLNNRIVREIENAPNKHIISIVSTLFPISLANVILELCNINPSLVAKQLSKKQRDSLVENTQQLNIPIIDTRSFNEAIITHGGVDVREFIPSTMESKIVKSLYVSGELLDIDALTGGYNMHIAFITGRAAGIAASNY